MDRQLALFERLKTLTTIPATSGFEQAIARRLLDEMRPLADRVDVDPFGSVFGILEGAEGAPRVMIPAHSDSVGMIVSHIEETGYLRFDAVGSVPPNLTYAQRVVCAPRRGREPESSVPSRVTSRSAIRRSGRRSRPWTSCSSMSVPPREATHSAWGSRPGSR